MRRKGLKGSSFSLYSRKENYTSGLYFSAIDQQIREMGTVILPYLQQHSSTVWSLIYRSPKTNLIKSRYFIACDEEDARKR